MFAGRRAPAVRIDLQPAAAGRRRAARSSAARATTAPIWQAIFNRDGRHFGLRYQTTGIHEDFQAGERLHQPRRRDHDQPDAPRAPGSAPSARRCRAGRRACCSTASVSTATSATRRPMPWLEKKLHFNNSFKFRGGWLAGASALFESFAFDELFYRDYALQAPTSTGPQILPFTGVAAHPQRRLRRHAQHAAVLAVLRQHLLHLGTRRELLRVVAGRRSRSRPTRSTGGRTTRSASARSISCSPTSAAATARRVGRRTDSAAEGGISGVARDLRPRHRRVQRAAAGHAAGRFADQPADCDSRSGRPASTRRRRRSSAIASASTRCSRISRRRALSFSPDTAAS